MNRAEFMRQLEKLLQDIPESDRLDAIAYYNDYFDEAGSENEAQVIQELGSPEKVAATIKSELGLGQDNSGDKEKESETYPIPEYKVSKKKNTPWLLIIILIILASPLLLSVGGGLIGCVVGILGAIVAISLGFLAITGVLLIAGLILFFIGIVRVFFSPVEGLATIGVGSLLLAIGFVLLVLIIWCIVKWIPALFRGVLNLIQRLFGRK